MHKFYLYLFGLFFIFVYPSCTLQTALSQEEEISVIFPPWPPEDSYQEEYPQLAFWKITITSIEKSESFISSEKSMQINLKKNVPCSIIFQPITYLSSRKLTEYFFPAGVLYPYEPISENKISATWEQGFLASCMATVINSKKETGITNQHMEEFISSFNWKKAIETIQKKIDENLSSPEKAFFNPWLIDKSRLLENLCYGNFKANFLNPTGIYTFTISNLFPNSNTTIISPFIPENLFLPEKNKINLKKNELYSIGDGKSFCLSLICKSAKNVSKEYIPLPIFIEDI